VTPQQCAAASSRPARALDAAWSTCPTTLRRARELHLSGWAFYVAGRGGALGSDLHPDVVAAALGFIAPDAVRAGWEAATAIGPAAVASARFAECGRWGMENLDPGEDAEQRKALSRLVELAELVVDGADATGMPLFAAWRSMPVPTPLGARVAVLAHLLTEHRAGAHLIAVRACGLSPLEATIAAPSGAQEAAALGWQPPYPPRLPLLRRYAYAEALGETVASSAYRGLTAGERGELVALLTRAAASVADAAASSPETPSTRPRTPGKMSARD
jgi:hypothetical protein